MATVSPLRPSHRVRPEGAPPAPGSFRVALADDCPLLMEGIAHSLEDDGGVSVAIRATSGEALLAALEHTAVDMVLIDPWIRSGDGLDAIAEIARRGDAPIVVALSAARLPDQVDEAMASGASGYIGKDVPPADLPSLMRRVASGVLVRPRATPNGGPVHALTAREREVLAMVADGLSNHEVGDRLFITEQTVKFHLGNVYRKLAASNRTEAARKAMKAGLIA
jgi:DNA-binding NarL/FixJ family response regulator